jgi:protein O-mannosyl-transferase
MPDTSPRNTISVRWLALWILTLALTVAVYWPGLDGDFLFDDNPHIVRNDLVQIDSLSPSDLWQAWNSSPLDFPNSRPLAMMTFGMNHAFGGLDPFAFKATNLALHLLAGLILIAVIRRLGDLFLRLEGRGENAAVVGWWAWLTATLWLLHPLNLSPVLLSVQRMTILSTLFVLLGMLVYLIGRQRLTDGSGRGLVLIWLSAVSAGIGLFAKENALLLPLLLFVTEWTLLRFRGLSAAPKRQLALFFLVVTALPILATIAYLATHPGYLGFAGRPFDLTERVLTQGRVLWFYVQLLFAPDISAMGLFHDDIAISRGLLHPLTTLPAVAALIVAFVTAILLRRKLPLFSFAVLFFLAGHALESSVIPLELVYEHRNYLPAVAPLFALAYLPTVGATTLPVSRGLLKILVASILLALAASTALRAYDWSGFGRLITAEVEHHPDSLRSNFQYAQLLMEQIKNDELSIEAAALAKEHFERIVALDEDHADGLFGMVVLELYLGRPPPQELIDRLAERLRRIPWSPMNVSTGQFAYLAKWHEEQGPATRLSREQMLMVFDAALSNPTLPPIGRAAILHALRAYYQRSLGEIGPALHYAELAMQAAPDNWELRDRHIRLLAATGRWDEAEAALRKAVEGDKLGLQEAQARSLADAIAAARRGEPVPTMPLKRHQDTNGSRP